MKFFKSGEGALTRVGWGAPPTGYFLTWGETIFLKCFLGFGNTYIFIATVICNLLQHTRALYMYITLHVHVLVNVSRQGTGYTVPVGVTHLLVSVFRWGTWYAPASECMQVGYYGYHSVAQGLAVGTQVLEVIQVVAEHVTKAQRAATLLHDDVVVKPVRTCTH